MPKIDQVVLTLNEDGFHQAVFIKTRDCYGDDIYEFRPFGNCCKCDSISNEPACWAPFEIED